MSKTLVGAKKTPPASGDDGRCSTSLREWSRVALWHERARTGNAVPLAAALHPGLAQLPPDEIKDARNLVLLLIDGLGYNYLSGPGAGSLMASRLAGRMTSVFPSTTASAITTTFTGLAPAEHGLTGWFTWFAEAGTTAAALPFMPRAAGETLADRGQAG